MMLYIVRRSEDGLPIGVAGNPATANVIMDEHVADDLYTYWEVRYVADYPQCSRRAWLAYWPDGERYEYTIHPYIERAMLDVPGVEPYGPMPHVLTVEDVEVETFAV